MRSMERAAARVLSKPSIGGLATMSSCSYALRVETSVSIFVLMNATISASLLRTSGGQVRSILRKSLRLRLREEYVSSPGMPREYAASRSVVTSARSEGLALAPSALQCSRNLKPSPSHRSIIADAASRSWKTWAMLPMSLRSCSSILCPEAM